MALPSWRGHFRILLMVTFKNIGFSGRADASGAVIPASIYNKKPSWGHSILFVAGPILVHPPTNHQKKLLPWTSEK